MRIEEADFILEPSLADCDDKYDLYILQDVKNTKNPRKEFKLVGYGKSLSSCMLCVCKQRATNKLNKESVTLAEYMKTLIDVKEELIQIFDELGLLRKR